jgi:dethiobiotin synthetase
MRLFITGTDTGVGKTYVSCGLLNLFKQQGLTTVAIKPVASGCEMTPQGLRNEDALLLQKHASVQLSYELINPISFEPPIAPHIAAQKVNFNLTTKNILKKCQPALNTPADIHLIEGAGGWLVPLHADETMGDLAQALDTEVILVVGLRLGCINHALLSIEAIKNKGCTLKGWIANHLDFAMLYQQENLLTLTERIKAPLLATMPYQGQALENISSAL